MTNNATKPKLFTGSDLKLNSSQICNQALSIVRRLSTKKFAAYLVGGAVRDLILKIEPKDFDIVTDATPTQIKKIFLSSKIIGRRFQIVHVQQDKKIFEVSTFQSKEMIEKIHEAGAEAALYMIHAYVEPHENTNPKMIEDIKKMYVDVGNKNNILVMPVGIAFENAYHVNPNIKLHKEYDGSHPNLLGTYLAACVVYASITQESPMKISYNYFNKIGDKDKNFLQRIAHETVEDFYNIKL